MHTLYFFGIFILSRWIIAESSTKRILHLDADNDGNYCYSDGDNFNVNTLTVVDDDNINRADYLKCIPPFVDIYASKGLEVYSVLKTLHEKYCIHVDLTYSAEVSKNLENVRLDRPPYYCDPTIDYVATTGKSCYDALKSPFLGSFSTAVSNAFSPFKYYNYDNLPYLTTTCADNSYAKYHFNLKYENGEVKVDAMVYDHETPQDVHYDLNSISMCDKTSNNEDEGAACLWFLDPDQLNTLPPDQQAGFSNTEVLQSTKDAAPIYRSTIDKTIPSGDKDTIVIYKAMARDFLVHCHLTPANTGFLRLIYQHDHERRYPTGYLKVCFCDWRNLNKLVTRCDCTKDGSQNNNCDAPEEALIQAAGVTCNNCSSSSSSSSSGSSGSSDYKSSSPGKSGGKGQGHAKGHDIAGANQDASKGYNKPKKP